MSSPRMPPRPAESQQGGVLVQVAVTRANASSIPFRHRRFRWRFFVRGIIQPLVTDVRAVAPRGERLITQRRCRGGGGWGGRGGHGFGVVFVDLCGERNSTVCSLHPIATSSSARSGGLPVCPFAAGFLTPCQVAKERDRARERERGNNY